MSRSIKKNIIYDMFYFVLAFLGIIELTCYDVLSLHSVIRAFDLFQQYLSLLSIKQKVNVK